MRNAVLQVALIGASESKRGIKTNEIGLSADFDRVRSVNGPDLFDGMPHEYSPI